MINSRAWCAACARPYLPSPWTGLKRGLITLAKVAGAVLGTFAVQFYISRPLFGAGAGRAPFSALFLIGYVWFMFFRPGREGVDVRVQRVDRNGTVDL